MSALAVVDQVVTKLRAAGIRADIDLDDVRVPGVWVQPRTVEPFNLGDDDALSCRLVAIVEDKSPRRVYEALLGLYADVKGVLGTPDDSSTFVTVNVPDGPALPGLAIPYQLVP